MRLSPSCALGTYAVTKKKYPHIQFDNCASGGKRLDYELMSRTFTVWRSDVPCHSYPEVAEANQIQNFYLHQWLPSHIGGTGAKTIDDLYKYVSAFSTGTQISCGRVAKADATQMKRILNMADKVKKSISKEFYQLSQNPENFENWCAYQGHNPESQEGFFVAFRRQQCQAEFMRVSLQAIDINAKYQLENKDGKLTEISGAELIDFKITLPKRGYAIYFYKKI